MTGESRRLQIQRREITKYPTLYDRKIVYDRKIARADVINHNRAHDHGTAVVEGDLRFGFALDPVCAVFFLAIARRSPYEHTPRKARNFACGIAR